MVPGTLTGWELLLVLTSRSRERDGEQKRSEKRETIVTSTIVGGGIKLKPLHVVLLTADHSSTLRRRSM
jgi:hypothetical protein